MAKLTKSGLPDRRGNGGKYLPNVQYQTLEQDDGKRDIVSKTISNVLAVSMQFAEPVKSDEEVLERLENYFNTCAETRQLVTIEKMCLALGLTREYVFEIINGRKQGFSRETANILKKAKEFISAVDADLALERHIDNVSYIFRSKNYYGMQDKQEVILTPNNRLSDYQDQATIEAKYAELPEE